MQYALTKSVAAGALVAAMLADVLGVDIGS